MRAGMVPKDPRGPLCRRFRRHVCVPFYGTCAALARLVVDERSNGDKPSGIRAGVTEIGGDFEEMFIR